jgi:hypothetical protein
MIFGRRDNARPGPPFRLHSPSPAASGTDPAGARRQSSPAQRDLVIGSISGYSFDDLQWWVNSLNRSGFSGDKVIIVYDASFDTVTRLSECGVRVATFAEDARKRRFHYPVKGMRHEDVSIDRFYQLWRYLHLHGADHRFVTAVDVRDVIFQNNPSDWLETHLGDMQINVGSEAIRIEDEPWNSEVILASYGPDIHGHMSRRVTWNAGTIAGRSDAIRDLALNIHMCSRHNAISYTDQAALNILLSLEPYRSITRFNDASADWACQAATAADPEYRAIHESRLLAPPPVLDGDCVRSPAGSAYCLVHQYDRIPEWKERLQQKYLAPAD